MSHPQRYFTSGKFEKDEKLGIEERGAKLDAEFLRIQEALGQLNTRVRQITSSDGKLLLDQAVRIRDVIDIQDFVGDGVQTRFDFAQPIDSAVDLVRTFVDGARVDPAGYDDTGVDFSPAPTGDIEVRIYTNMAGVLDRIQALVYGEGASYIGFDDPEGTYEADNVRDALAEVRREFDTLVLSLDTIGEWLLRDGSRTLTGNWPVNERAEDTIPSAAASGQIITTDQPLDGDYVTISDGVNTTTFEFDDDASVAAGNVAIAIGADYSATMETLVAAISNAPLAITPVGTDSAPTQYTIDLTAQVPGTLANVPIAGSGLWYSALTGMAGGVQGSFDGYLKTKLRPENIPPSTKDGDPVVHEQLAETLSILAASINGLLRTDGGNAMAAPLDGGGYPHTNMADGVEATDGANKGQLDTAVNGLVPTKGTRDPARADDATLLGPINFGETAESVASADQTLAETETGGLLDPISEDDPFVKTAHGIPQASAPDQPVNKFQFDAKNAEQDGRLTAAEEELGLTSGNLGGCSLDLGGAVDITLGGRFDLSTDSEIVSAQVVPSDVEVYVEGDFTVRNTITVPTGGRIRFSCSGVLTLDPGAVLTAPDGEIDLTANSIAIGAGADLLAGRGLVRLTDTDGLVAGVINVTGSLYRTGGPCVLPCAHTADAVTEPGGRSVTSGSLSVSDITFIGGFGGAGALGGLSHPSDYMAGAFNIPPLDREGYSWFTRGGGELAPEDLRDPRLRYNGNGGDGGLDFNTGGGGAGGGGAGGGGAGGAPSKCRTPTFSFGAKRLELSPPGFGGTGGSGGVKVFDDPSHVVTSGEGGRGGGVVDIYSSGELDLTGATFSVDGGPGGPQSTDGTVPQSVGYAGGAGGAGAFRAVAAGPIRGNPIVTAIGGSGSDPIGGGGGTIALAATDYPDGPLTNLTATGAVDGDTAISTYTADEIKCLHQSGVW